MSHIESPPETFIRFDRNPSWKNAPENVLIADFLSANGESNLLWTPSFYEERDGKMYDPIRKMFVSGTANGDVVEEGVITQLENWFVSHESGLGVWISPRGNGIRPYPEEQITVYRIAYRWPTQQKILLFSWHQFKADFKNPEEIRSFIFTENDKEESVFEIINWLNQTSQKPVASDYGNIEERRERAEYYVFRYKSGLSMTDLAYEMGQVGFLGKNPIGCGGVTLAQTSPYSETLRAPLFCNNEGWHAGTCRVCGSSTWVGPCEICKPCESKF